MKAIPVAVVCLASMAVLAGASITSSVLEDHPAEACSFPFFVTGAGWDFCWQQDDVRAHGLELNQVYFHDELVIWKIGVPFSLTQYDGGLIGPFKDTLGTSAFGASDNPGYGRGPLQIHPEDCPRFLGEGVLLSNRYICVEHRQGPEPAVAIWARYDIFNYRFLQGYIMDSRGVMEPFVRLGGTLIDGPGADGTNHFHHVYWRVDFDIAGGENDTVQGFTIPQEDLKRFARNESLPSDCRQAIRMDERRQCDVPTEAALSHHHGLIRGWRVVDPEALNPLGRGRSFEVVHHSEHEQSGGLTHLNALALEYKGDALEVGFEVPPNPFQGDAYLAAYYDPVETIADPVLWVAVNAYHDTRDEETPTMSYHHVSFTIQPRNFFGENPGEDSYDPRRLPQPPVQTPIEPV